MNHDMRGSQEHSRYSNYSLSYSNYVDESEEAAVFGHRVPPTKAPSKKHESVVSLKKKEMERMRREMATGKVEGVPGGATEESNKREADDVDLFAAMESDFNSKEEAWKNKKKGVKTTKKKKGKQKGHRGGDKKEEKTKGKKLSLGAALIIHSVICSECCALRAGADSW